MDTNSPLTAYTRISPDAIPLAILLDSLCTTEDIQERIFRVVLAILRGEEPDVSGLPAEASAAIPRLRALARTSLEMVGYFFGDVEAPSINSHPVFVAQDTLGVALTAHTATTEDVRRLLDVFKRPGTPIPEDLPPPCQEAAQVMQLLDKEYIEQIEGWFFGEDPGNIPPEG